MFINQYGEYCESRVISDPETNEIYKEIRVYQDNGWVRISCIYSDGTTTETFERE